MGSRGDSKEGIGPKTQRLKEIPEIQNTGRKGRGEREGAQGIWRQGDARDTWKHVDTGMAWGKKWGEQMGT